MKYSEAKDMANSLREFADFVENHGPKMPVDFYIPTINVFVYDESVWDYEAGGYTVKTPAKQRFADATKTLVRACGKVEKKWDGSYLEVIAKFGTDVTLELNLNRESVCKRVVVEKVEVPEKTIPAYTKEVVEWVCEDPALLNLAS